MYMAIHAIFTTPYTDAARGLIDVLRQRASCRKGLRCRAQGTSRFFHGCSLLVPSRYHPGIYTRVSMLPAYFVVIPFFLGQVMGT